MPVEPSTELELEEKHIMARIGTLYSSIDTMNTELSKIDAREKELTDEVFITRTNRIRYQVQKREHLEAIRFHKESLHRLGKQAEAGHKAESDQINEISSREV